jgi:hypothetical protein
VYGYITYGTKITINFGYPLPIEGASGSVVVKAMLSGYATNQKVADLRPGDIMGLIKR